MGPAREVLGQEKFREGAFVVPGCEPGRVYPVVLFDSAGGLGAVAEVRQGEKALVRLEKCGSIEVRVVDQTKYLTKYKLVGISDLGART
jgi:hypothetical protein